MRLDMSCNRPNEERIRRLIARYYGCCVVCGSPIGCRHDKLNVERVGIRRSSRQRGRPRRRYAFHEDYVGGTDEQ